MSKPDLEAVMQRRAMIARELSALEKMKVEMTAEDEELQVAERVLRRLAQMSGAQAIAYVESEARPLEQVDED